MLFRSQGGFGQGGFGQRRFGGGQGGFGAQATPGSMGSGFGQGRFSGQGGFGGGQQATAPVSPPIDITPATNDPKAPEGGWGNWRAAAAAKKDT